MNADYLSDLYDYDSTMNAQILDLLRQLPDVEARTRTVFAHLLIAKKIWITRLRGDDTSGLVVWPELSWTNCGTLIAENQQAYRDYLAGITEADLAANIAYTNTKGTAFRTSARDILMHVLIHGGYHRGQIAAAVRAKGGEPINTDYITYIR